MKKQPTLASRIIVAFFLFSMVVSGSFSVSVFFTIHFVESRLISAELKQDLEQYIKQRHNQENPELASGLQIFYDNDQHPQTIPTWVKSIPPGYQEVFRGDYSYHSWVEDYNGTRYFLLSDQSDFERHERILLFVIIFGFFLSLICSWILGKKIVAAAIEPVIRLSNQVSSQSRLLNKKFILSDEYANDEVGQLAAAFDHLTDKFRETLERERLFSADLSHELRTPLMIIASGSELLLADKNLPETHRNRVISISTAAEDMRQLVYTLLMLLRSENNDTEELPLSTLYHISTKTEQEWRPAIEKNGLGFHVTNHNTEDSDMFPEVFVQIILNNLLRNALHHTRQGSIHLTTCNDCIEVKDTGIGIPQPIQSKIFEPFFQGAGDTEVTSNLGLGLSLVHRICTHQHWTIELDSSKESGTRFLIAFNR